MTDHAPIPIKHTIRVDKYDADGNHVETVEHEFWTDALPPVPSEASADENDDAPGQRRP